ncbi:unnamed protein product, partial [Nesidiocoris tenuis]
MIWNLYISQKQHASSTDENKDGSRRRIVHKPVVKVTMAKVNRKGVTEIAAKGRVRYRRSRRRCCTSRKRISSNSATFIGGSITTRERSSLTRKRGKTPRIDRFRNGGGGEVRRAYMEGKFVRQLPLPTYAASSTTSPTNPLFPTLSLRQERTDVARFPAGKFADAVGQDLNFAGIFEKLRQ